MPKIIGNTTATPQSEITKDDLATDVQELINSKANDDEVLHLSGGELTGILYTSASTPLIIGKQGKIGLRAAMPEELKSDHPGKVHVGQINISNAWWNKGEGEIQDQWGTQISGYNGKTGKYNELRVSHNGVEYNSEDGTTYTVLHSGNTGVANGIATLDENGHVPSTQLPSYVDDVIEGYISGDKTKCYEDEEMTEEITPEASKIFIDIRSLRTYRWSGTRFAEISESLALGETSNTAYYGDKGKTAYVHSQITSGNPHGVTATEIGLKTKTFTFTFEDGSTETVEVYVK